MNGKECSDCSQWNQIVLDMRKLREALTAIGERESKFAGETFELSVDINIQSGDEGELIKSMSHLVDYARLCRQVECRHRMLECYLLFRLCLAVRAEEAEYLSDFVQAYYEISVNSSAGFPLIKRLYRCLFSVQSYIEFWRIYRAMLDTRQRMLVEKFIVPLVRRRAMAVVRRSYLQIDAKYLADSILENSGESGLPSECLRPGEWKPGEALVKFK